MGFAYRSPPLTGSWWEGTDEAAEAEAAAAANLPEYDFVPSFGELPPAPATKPKPKPKPAPAPAVVPYRPPSVAGAGFPWPLALAGAAALGLAVYLSRRS